MVFQSALEFFRPFPILGILLVSFLVTLLVTLVYKWTTKQAELKKLKKELKDLQGQLKSSAKMDPKKAMAIQKKAMEKNFQLMKHSLRPTLFTFLPLILIFGWLNAHMAYYEIPPGNEFSITGEFDKYLVGNATIMSTPSLDFIGSNEQQVADGKATWRAKGDTGTYSVTIKDGSHEFTTALLISQEWKYSAPERTFKGTSLKKVIIGNEKVRPFGSWFNIFGWRPGWLASYIISSIAFSMLLRKLMDVA
jgi:uncharacterized membrane protein (DUF106 family)